MLPLHHAPKHFVSIARIHAFVNAFAKFSVLILPGQQLAHDVVELRAAALELAEHRIDALRLTHPVSPSDRRILHRTELLWRKYYRKDTSSMHSLPLKRLFMKNACKTTIQLLLNRIPHKYTEEQKQK